VVPFLEHLLLNFEVDAKKFCESGALAVALAAMAHEELELRRHAYNVVGLYFELLEQSDFVERPQLTLLLRMFRNSISSKLQRVRPLTASFFNEAAWVMLRPDHHLYAALNCFLLQRPIYDVEDVPMFYQLFHSATEYSAHDRKWMLRVLCEGVHTEADYQVLRRRHGLALLMAFASSSSSGVNSRRTVLKILWQTATAHEQTLVDCVEHCGVTSWLVQLACDTGRSWSLRLRAVRLLRLIVTRLHARLGPECVDLARSILIHAAANLSRTHTGTLTRTQRTQAQHFALLLLDLVRVVSTRMDTQLRDIAVERFIETHLPLQRRQDSLHLTFWQIQVASSQNSVEL